MAENLFQASDPGCNVTPVPKLDFQFVEDCVIPPPPPPIFECVLPVVPNEPCILCPEFDINAVLKTGKPDCCLLKTPTIESRDLLTLVEAPIDAYVQTLKPYKTWKRVAETVWLEEECPPLEPKFEIRIEKTENNPCRYDFSIELNVPIPEPPCPVITVTQFDVSTHFARDPDDENCGCVLPNFEGEVLEVATLEDRDALPIEEVPVGSYVKTLLPSPVIWWRKSENVWNPATDPLAPTCNSVFRIKPKYRPPENCGDPGQCEFDIDLVIDVPIPRIPCPVINITQFNVSTHFKPDPEDENCGCVLPNFDEEILDVLTAVERDALSLVAAPVGAYVRTTVDPENTIWLRKAEAEWELVEDPSAPICKSIFRIKPKHRAPEDCNDPGQCEFDIDLVIDVPIPRVPCPIIRIDPPTVTTGYDDSPCFNCDADMTVFSKENLDAVVDPQPGMHVRVLLVVTKYRWDGTVWQPAETLDVATRLYEHTEFDNTLMDGQLPDRCDTVPTIFVATEAELPTENIAVGTIAVISNYTERYKYETDWQPAPCAKNSFQVTTKRCPPKDCNDPGQCEFDLKLDLVVPIPRPPCPEIKISSFSVTTVNEENLSSPECDVAATVDTLAELEELTAPALTDVYVVEEKAIYTRSGGQWYLNDEKTACCGGSKFKITARTEKCGPTLTVATIAARDALTSPADIKEGEIVEVLEPPKTYWRAGNGFTTARWTPVTVDECCVDDKCVFDVELDIRVPLPPIVCPEFVGTVHTNVGYEDTFCTSCDGHITVLDKDGLPANPPAGFDKKYYYGKVQQAAHQFKYIDGNWSEVGRVDVVNNLPISGTANKPIAFVATEDDRDSVLDQLGADDIVEVLFPADRYRKNVLLNTPWERYPCGKVRTASKKTEPTCDSPGQCVLGFEIDIDVPVPRPPCPSFATAVRASAEYERGGELCADCPADIVFRTVAALIASATSGGIPISDGTTAFVKQNKTKYVFLVALGGWTPVGCQSSFIIAKAPTPPSQECAEPEQCVFNATLDLVVPIPQPPCPAFNIRKSDFKVNCNANFPRFDFGISQRANDSCKKDDDECAKTACLFDVDLDLEIPCPIMRGGPISVMPVSPDKFVGGWLNVGNGCESLGPQTPCPAANFISVDIVERDRQLVQELRAIIEQSLQPNQTTGAVLQQPGRGLYLYGGGAECGEPVWYWEQPLPNNVGPGIANHTVNSASQLGSIAHGIAAAADGTLIGQIFKTTQPEPAGAYWKYLGGVLDGQPVWERVVCDDIAQTNCSFLFGGAITVPYCEPELAEDDDQGTHTGVKKEDRLKIYYLKPNEYCPPDEDECADKPAAVQAANEDALIEMLGEAPAEVEGLTAAGVPVTVPVVPGAPTVFKVGDTYYRAGAGLPVSFNPIPCAGDDCPRDFVQLHGGLPPANKRGKAPNPALADGVIAKTTNNNKFWKCVVPGGGAPDPLGQAGAKGHFIEIPCGGESNVRLVVAPDPNNPCRIWYAVKIKVCLPQVDHVAECTQYYGDPCCDTGCPCDLESCCDSEEKASVEDGSQGDGIPPYYRDDLPAEEFRATPTTVVGTELPRLAQQADPPPAERNDPCVEAVSSAGEGCTELPPPTDAGYRPYKALELQINEEYPADRLSPPVVKYSLEAAMNCLHGGTVTVKKGTAPVAPAAFNMPDEPGTTTQTGRRPRMATTDPDTIGEGEIRVEQNRINLDITLYTAECTTPTPPPPAAPFRAAPDTLALTEEKTLTPALLAELISAINTDPALKAAIRNIVNQPD